MIDLYIAFARDLRKHITVLQEGYLARCAGFKTTDCPYQGERATEWQRGYSATFQNVGAA